MPLSEKVTSAILSLTNDPALIKDRDAYKSMHFVLDGDSSGGWVDGPEPKDDDQPVEAGLASRMIVGYIDRSSVIGKSTSTVLLYTHPLSLTFPHCQVVMEL